MNRVERRDAEEGRGFNRIPQPNPGGVFFALEGDPPFDGGLQYLFGFVHDVDGNPVFVPFWGHARAEEKVAFEQAMHFILKPLAALPDAYIAPGEL